MLHLPSSGSSSWCRCRGGAGYLSQGSLRDLPGQLPWWLLVLLKPGNIPAWFGSAWAGWGSGHGVQTSPTGHLRTFGELLERGLVPILLLLWSVSHRRRDTALVPPLPAPPPLNSQNSLCLFQSKDSPISFFPASPRAVSDPLHSHSRVSSRHNAGRSFQLCLRMWVIGWLCPNHQKTTPKLPASVFACS